MKLAVQIVHRADGWYLATCPSLPGCVTRGQTQEEAERRLRDAIRGYLGALNTFVPGELHSEMLRA